jgi:hypothetical protein
MRIAFCILFLSAFIAAPVFAQQTAEPAKIDYLINVVADLHDARFIRNGVEYDAAQAADHLRLKLRYAGSHVKTAENFIVECATGSSMTGEKYRIKFSDGRIVEVAAFLRDKLAAYPAPK